LWDVHAVSTYLPYIVIGIITGSAYGIAALGLVLTYKTSGVFNFGHGAVAATAATIFYQLHTRNGMSWPLAALISVVGFGVVAGLVLERFAAALAGVSTAYRIVATTGLILMVPAGFTLLYGQAYPTLPPFLPDGRAFNISDVQIHYDGIITIAVGLLSVVALYLFFRRSRLGVAMRAVVDRPELVDLTGESPARIRRISWIIGATFAAISGLLLVDTLQQLNVNVLSLLVVAAFGAAAIGAFQNLPLAYAGGVLLGVVQEVTGEAISGHSLLQGLDITVPFLFLFIALLVVPRARLVELGVNARRRARSATPILSRNQKRLVVVVVAILAVLVPNMVGGNLPAWSEAAAELPLFLSLGLLVRTSGQISLCHLGFAAIGATTFAHAEGHNIPWGIAVVLGGLLAVPAGAIVSIPAIRLSGLYLALATLGFGIFLGEFLYTKSIMFGSSVTLASARPHVFGLQGEKGYYYTLLAFGAMSIAVVLFVERSRMGRLLRSIADSPTALSTLGTNINVTRVMIFCLSAFMAGISGALIAGLFSSVGQGPFAYLESLVVLAVLMISGTRTVPAAIVGTVLLNIPPAYVAGDTFLNWLQIFFGGAAIAVACLSGGRILAFVNQLLSRSQDRWSVAARSNPPSRPALSFDSLDAGHV
jgi:branched-subunit amino acid ABC-type transport system permease component